MVEVANMLKLVDDEMDAYWSLDEKEQLQYEEDNGDFFYHFKIVLRYYSIMSPFHSIIYSMKYGYGLVDPFQLANENKVMELLLDLEKIMSYKDSDFDLSIFFGDDDAPDDLFGHLNGYYIKQSEIDDLNNKLTPKSWEHYKKLYNLEKLSAPRF